MKYNPDVHHRRSIRLPDYDYSQSGAYFVTLCTKERELLFGEIRNINVILNDVGKMVQSIWKSVPQRYSNVLLDEFVVMPNHFHAIIAIAPVGAGFPRPDNSSSNQFTTLGKIVAYFKYQCTKQINMIYRAPGKPLWQRNYFERIIRNDEELDKIREYIVLNPVKWATDSENPDCVSSVEESIW